MLPRVVNLTGLDVYRDGGSISVSFDSNDDSQYCLHFQFKWSAMADQEFEVIGYKPVLKKYIRTEYVSPITGIRNPDWKEESNEVSWDEARILLDELKPHINGFDPDDLWVFEEMVKVASRDGAK